MRALARKRLAFAGGFAILLASGSTAHAQETGEPVERADESVEEVVDVIVVQGRRSRGMAAFEAGDFATAEIEFAKNARCALRRERNRAAALDQIRSNQIGQELGTQPTVQGNPTDGNAVPPPVPTQSAPDFQAPSQNQGPGTDDSLDCGNRGQQVYMKALSQLQLGKVEEAERSLKQAATLNKNLYDAQYRLGLIALLRDDEKAARRRLKAIKSILKRCRRCDVRDEIIVRRDHLDAALRGEVDLGDG